MRPGRERPGKTVTDGRGTYAKLRDGRFNEAGARTPRKAYVARLSIALGHGVLQ